jgi:hypothetical protein
MRPRIFATALAAVAVFVTGGVSHAAPKPKPVCNLLTDKTGDVVMALPGAGPVPYADTTIDLRSVDVVSDNEGLGVTLRVAGLGTASTSSTHTDLSVEDDGYWVFLTLESTGRELGLYAQVPADNATGPAYEATGGKATYYVGAYLNDTHTKYSDEWFSEYGPARGVVDAAKAEVRMSVSWADLKKYGYTHAKRDRVVKIRALTRDWWASSSYADGHDPGGVRYASAPHDDATAAAAYPLGAKSCATKVPA